MELDNSRISGSPFAHHASGQMILSTHFVDTPVATPLSIKGAGMHQSSRRRKVSARFGDHRLRAPVPVNASCSRRYSRKMSVIGTR